MLDFGTLIYRVPAILFAISIHEYAHAQCADSLGDPTPRYAGRLTLNPLAHMDILGAILFVLTGFGWAKGVEVNTRYFKKPQMDMLKVSLAGPAANLFLCFLALLVLRVMSKFGVLSLGVKQLLSWMVYINVWFAFFNIIPIPPLDGHRILTAILPAKQAWEFEEFVGKYYQYMIYGLLFLVMFGFTDAIIRPLSSMYISLINVILGIIF